jgi:hypothetical protein
MSDASGTRSAAAAHVHRARCSGHRHAILLEAAGIAVRGRVTQPSDSPIRLAARGRLLLRGANGGRESKLLSVLGPPFAARVRASLVITAALQANKRAQGLGFDAGGGTRTPDTRIMIPLL